ncbi:integrase, catalytic region, zinc finger, CCHC-type containing protein [Tanacetum coccineum]
MANLSEDIQCAGSDTRPPMLDRTDFASWQQRIRLYCRGKENGVNILKSIDEGPFQMGTIRDPIAEGTEGAQQLGPERARVYSDLSPEDKDRYNADIRATNILLQGLPKDIYTLINHYTEAKDIWDNVKMLLEGSELTKEDRESQLMQLNSKFVNNMLPEWGRFVTALKLNRGLKDSNYDQLYAYLKQHEAHANENKMMLDRFTQHTIDPLALMSNVSQQHAAGYRGAQNRVGNANPGQARQIKCYNCNGIGHIARKCTQPKRPQNSKYFKDKMLLMQAQENRVAFDEEQLLFIVGGQDNAVDEDVYEQPVQDLALNVDNVFQADDYDAFYSDVDEAPTTQTMFMTNLSSADPVYDEAGPSYDSDILSEVHDHDHYQDVVCKYHEVHKMHDDVQPNYVTDSHADYTSDSNMIPYDQYVKDNTVIVVQSNVSSIPNDAYMMILNDIYELSAQCVSMPTQNNVVDNSLTAELSTYKEQVELYERRVKFELTNREQKINEQLRIVISDHNHKEENLKRELHSIKLQLAFTINHNKLIVQEVTSLKNDFKQKENKYLEEFLDMKALKEKNKVAIGYKNPLCITREKQVHPALYNGQETIKTNHVPAIVHNSEDTLEIAEITRKKMNDKMKDLECVKKKSKDLIKMKAEALKEQTTASRPIKALAMYPLNTPATLVLRVLPTKELEAEVDQNVVNRKHDEIERKNLLITNDNLIADCLSKEVFYIRTNSELTISRFTKMHAAHTVVQARSLELKAELSKLLDKITRAKHIKQTTALLTENENLKAQIHENLKCITMDSVKPRVLATGRYAIDVEPIPPRNRNNREVHLDYLKHLKESVETLREIVEEAKVERPLDSSLAFACLYTKHSQELLEYVIGTCLKDFNQRDKNHAATPLTRKKQVTFEDQCETSNSNTHKRVEQLNIQKTNVPVPPSTGVNSCTDASGSQPRSNTKKNRILPAKSVNKKQVEEHPRTNKSSLKTTNRVDSSISSKRTVINLNSHYACQTCNKCLISANHDVCLVNYLHSVNVSPSVKNVVRKVKQVWILKQVKQVWKAIGKVLTSVGCQWRPTGRIFTLGEQCPLTRLTKPKVLPATQTKNVSTSKYVITKKLSHTAQKLLTRYQCRNQQYQAVLVRLPTSPENQAIAHANQ